MDSIILPDTEFQRQLRYLVACLEARLWVGDKTFAEAWNSTDQKSWMIWLLDQLRMTPCTCYGGQNPSCLVTLVVDSSIEEIRVRFPEADVHAKLLELVID